MGHHGAWAPYLKFYMPGYAYPKLHITWVHTPSVCISQSKSMAIRYGAQAP